MSESKIKSIVEVQKMLEEISNKGIDAFTHEELCTINDLITLIKETKLDITLSETITKKALTGLFD